MLIVLGAGYIGAALAELALSRGEDVCLADNWYATDRAQVEPLAARGVRVETADIRRREDVDRLLSLEPSRVFLLAAQASRPISEREPGYTEETNVTGVRLVAEAVARRGGPGIVFASSLRVYGTGVRGDVDASHPYGEQDDLAHLSKIYGELVLTLHARRAGFDLALLRLGIVYGRSPVEHERPESTTVVERFRRLAARGERLPLDDGGAAAIGVVHVEDTARILLEAPPETGVSAANVAAETVTVADVAALAEGRDPAGGAAVTFVSPFRYERRLADYLRAT